MSALPSDSTATDVARASLEALEKLTPAVAHDLRGGINTLAFQIEILRGAAGADAARREKTLSVLVAELDRLHGQIERLVAVVAPRPSTETVVDLGTEVTQLVDLLVAYGRKKRITIDLQLPETPARVRGQLAPLRRALLAWGIVAVDLAPVAGRARLEVAFRDGPPSLLASWANSEGDAHLVTEDLDLSALESLFAPVGGRPTHQGPTGIGVQFAPSSND